MMSSTVKVVRNVLAFFGAIGSVVVGFLVPAVRLGRYGAELTSFNWRLVIGSLLSTVFTFFVFTIVVTILENQENIILQLQNMDTQGKEKIRSEVTKDIPSYSAKNRNL